MCKPFEVLNQSFYLEYVMCLCARVRLQGLQPHLVRCNRIDCMPRYYNSFSHASFEMNIGRDVKRSHLITFNPSSAMRWWFNWTKHQFVAMYVQCWNVLALTRYEEIIIAIQSKIKREIIRKYSHVARCVLYLFLDYCYDLFVNHAILQWAHRL